MAGLLAVCLVLALLNFANSASFYTAGDDFYGQVGNTGLVVNELTLQGITIPGNPMVRSVIAGEDHMLAITADGEVYTWGRNGQLQLGYTTTTFFGEYLPGRTPKKVALPAGAVITQAALGTAFTVLLDESANKVYTFGSSGKGQLCRSTSSSSANLIYSVPMTFATGSSVVQISAGSEHVLFRLANGKVYGCGSAEYKQLGLATNQQVPVQVSIPEGKAVSYAAAGYHHSLFISEGKVFAVGRNGDGQLSLQTTAQQATVTGVTSPTFGGENIVSVAGGQGHSLFLTESGKVWASGQQYLGQLGNGLASDANVQTAQLVYSANRVSRVSTFGRSSLLLLDDGTVVGFGTNQNGMLARGLALDTPWLEDPTPLGNSQAPYYSVSAGFKTSIWLPRTSATTSTGSTSTGTTSSGTTSSGTTSSGTTSSGTTSSGTTSSGTTSSGTTSSGTTSTGTTGTTGSIVKEGSKYTRYQWQSSTVNGWTQAFRLAGGASDTVPTVAYTAGSPLDLSLNARDDVYVTTRLSPYQNASTLYLTRFTGVTIPSNAVIEGVKVITTRYSSQEGLKDLSMRLIINGVVVPETERYLTGPSTYWYTSEKNFRVGGLGDFWGLPPSSFTPAVVNSLDFGVAYTVGNVHKSRTINAYFNEVDFIISYSVPIVHRQGDQVELQEPESAEELLSGNTQTVLFAVMAVAVVAVVAVVAAVVVRHKRRAAASVDVTLPEAELDEIEVSVAEPVNPLFQSNADTATAL